tara:strand:- start:2477 stop:2866 length:390 start_codon:yes stop_codon:yes gene_type:complete
MKVNVPLGKEKVMNSIRRHVELQRQARDAYNFGCDLMVETVMAVCTGHWVVDGACDPSAACERMQKALLARDHDAISAQTDALAEAVFRAHRAGDFTPVNDNELAFVARAEARVEQHYDELIDFDKLAA